MLTVDSKVKQLIDNPETRAIMDEMMAPVAEAMGVDHKFSEDPRLKLAHGMTFRAVAGFTQAGISPELFAEIEERLEEAQIEGDDDDDEDY